MTTLTKTGRALLLAAASSLALSAAAGADTIRFWTTEEQPERLARQEAMAADFTAETGIEVEVIPVTESDLGTRATAAFAAGDLPDVIYHTLQYALPWAEAGILDREALERFSDVRGIRIEDDVLCTEGDPDVFTAQIPKAPDQVEAAVGRE